MEPSQQDTVAQVLHRHAGQAHRLVQILREVQEHTHWLPAPVLEQVAQGVGLGAATVRGRWTAMDASEGQHAALNCMGASLI